MARERTYGDWRLDEVLPAEMDAAAARDILIDCFYSVHGEHFAATKSQLGISAEDKHILRSVKGAVRLGFRSVGGSFDAPTKADLTKVAEYLAEKSRSWGAPESAIQRHQAEFVRVFSRVPEI